MFKAELSTASKIVYIYLSNLMNASSKNGKDFVFPSAATIAKNCNVSTSTAKRSLYELKDKGFLTITNRKGATSEIRLTRVNLTRPPVQNDTTLGSKRTDSFIRNRKGNQRDINNGHIAAYDSDAYREKAQRPIEYSKEKKVAAKSTDGKKYQL